MSEMSQKQEDKKIKQVIFIFTTNEDKNTASIVGIKNNTEDIIIPRSINYQSKEYIVTTIEKKAFSLKFIKSVEFPVDTAIRTIEKRAFYGAFIENISIPASLVNLEDGWCENTNYLVNITVNPNNPRYSVYQNKFIIGKSSSESANYDVLVFCVRNIEKVTIPSFIKYIGAHAFDSCKKLKNIEIPSNSELHKIGERAFCYTSIESFFIPSNLIEIEKSCFESAREIVKVSVSPNNQRYSLLDGKVIIGKSSLDINEYDSIVLSVRNIESIVIPSFIKHISECAFDYCIKLCTVEFSEDSELRTFGYKSFRNTSIISIKIPPHVTRIFGFSFAECRNLQTVEISKNSELELIDEYAFSGTSINNFNIPIHVKRIGSSAFYKCTKLHNLEIPINAELQKLDDSIIAETNIRNITFPSNLVEVGEIASLSPLLCRINVGPNNNHFKVYENKMLLGKSNPENNIFDVFVFCFKDVEFVRIPNFIKIIKANAFKYCDELHTVEFEENSKLEEIQRSSFYGSSIKSIKIPPKITRICENTFAYCEDLRSIDISTNSRLQILESNSFCNTPIEHFTIPPHLIIIGSGSFSECEHLRKIDFEKNSELQIIENDAFFESEIESFVVPKTVKKIDNGAFSFCSNFKIIEFDENSEIERIGSIAFISSDKLVLMIPVKLSENSFNVFSNINEKDPKLFNDSDE